VTKIPIFWKLSSAFVIIIALILLVSDFVSAEMSRGPLQTVLGLLCVALLGIGFSWLAVSLFIKRPVRRLSDAMSRLAEREFDFRLDENERDEFGSLESSFNDMADMLSASLRELKKNQDYLRSVLESSADIIITVNPSGQIQTLNKGAEQALGYSRIELIGKPMETLFADPRERDAAIERLQYADNVVNYETRFVSKAGEVRNVLLTVSRLRNAAGAIIGTIGISKDVTVEKRLQSKLIQSQRLVAIGEVFTGIQHSMKNMLNACKGGAYMVNTGLSTDNPDMLVEGWAMVQEGIDRMTSMAQGMLSYVKVWVPRSERTDLAQILCEIHRVVKQTAADKGVKFRLDIPSELPPLLCDAKMIHTAVMDIVSNALDACTWKIYNDVEEPEIVLTAFSSSDRRESIVEVRDNGCGMTEEVKANIFTPFFSTKSKAGTGLGLSLTSRAIDVHGGTIDVESEPNRGTTFRIMIPVNGIGKNKEQIDGKEGPGS
jgi:two-component system sensor histidine kinase AtoS